MGFAAATNWEAALREFLLSREKFPTKSATRNAAIALLQLKRYAESFELYTRLIDEFSSTIDAGQLASDQAAAKEAQSHTGELEIRASEPDASILLDGMERGDTRATHVVLVDEGEHTLRLSKAGFEPFELTLRIAVRERKVVRALLNPLQETGALLVKEAGGRALDVVLDGVRVGRTPWHGDVAPGRHLVVLRGPGALGTAPCSSDVKGHDTTTLTLAAVVLDSAIRIDPTPANAEVFFDDVPLGNGSWQGRVPSGSHHVDAIANGHLAFRRDVYLPPGRTAFIPATLDRDVARWPLWRTPSNIGIYAELTAGLLFAPSLRGGADESCQCSQRSRPFGALGGIRAGLSLGRLGFEIEGGYLSIAEHMTRTVQARGEIYSPSFTADDFADSTTLSGPFAALGLSYRLLEKTPVTARAGFGIASLEAATANEGTFSGAISNFKDPSETQRVQDRLIFGEQPARLLTPFASTEIRIGYRFSKIVTADLGSAIMLFFPQHSLRNGTYPGVPSDTRGARFEAKAIGSNASATWRDGSAVNAGLVSLPKESIASSFIALCPSVNVRASF